MSKWLKDEQIIKTILNCKNGDGLIKPTLVVREAEHKTSPLHDYFEWDDKKGARKYRLMRARGLIRLVVVYDERTRRNVPMLHHINVVDDKETIHQGYVTLNVIKQNEDYRAQIMRNITKTIRHWQTIEEAIGEVKKMIVEEEVVKAEKKYA